MAQTVMVVHGAGEPRRRRAKVYWEPLLGTGLGSGYRVHAPRMPRPARPQYWAWAQRIDELLTNARRPVVVGHSLGASVLLKFLAETVRRPSFAGLFLIAAPFWRPDLRELALPPDFGVRLRNVSPLYLYHSRDDPEVPFEHLERYHRELPHAVARPLEGRAHEFDQTEFPELVADIRRVTAVTRARMV